MVYNDPNEFMPREFIVETDKNNEIIFKTNAKGNDVLRTPLLNKDTSFSKEERDALGLTGLMPPRILNLEGQIKIIHRRYQRLGASYELLASSMNFSKAKLSNFKKTLDITRFNFLRNLHNRHEILFYAFCK